VEHGCAAETGCETSYVNEQGKTDILGKGLNSDIGLPVMSTDLVFQ